MIKRTPINTKLQTCGKCKKQRPIFADRKCESCKRPDYGYIKRGANPISKSVKPISKVRKPTGELALFKKIWQERPHYCEMCGTEVYRFDHNNFAHLLSKGAYRSLRLVEENIVIMCHNKKGTGCHNKYDTKARTDLENKDSRWHYVFELAARIKEKYYREHKVTKK